MILNRFGKESISSVVSEVIGNPDIDAGVIRSCINSEEIEALEAAREICEDGGVTDVIESIVPQFDEVGKIVSQWWDEHGYSNFDLNEQLYFTDYVPHGRGISPHIDYYDNLGEFIQAGVSFSLSVGSTGSRALVRVARPRGIEFSKDDGSIDIDKLLGWQAIVSSNEVEWQESTLNCGDVLVLPQHNTPAGHSVVADDGRAAYILDYLAFSA